LKSFWLPYFSNLIVVALHQTRQKALVARAREGELSIQNFNCHDWYWSNRLPFIH